MDVRRQVVSCPRRAWGTDPPIAGLKPLGFGVGHLPVLVALQAGRAHSSRTALTKLALARLPEAIATLFRGNRDAVAGFTDEEIVQLVALLDRLITNLDRLSVAP